MQLQLERGKCEWRKEMRCKTTKGSTLLLFAIVKEINICFKSDPASVNNSVLGK